MTRKLYESTIQLDFVTLAEITWRMEYSKKLHRNMVDCVEWDKQHKQSTVDSLYMFSIISQR